MSLVSSGAVNEIRSMMEMHKQNTNILICGLEVLKNAFLVDEETYDSMSISVLNEVLNSTIPFIVNVMKDNICNGDVCMHCCEVIGETEQGKIRIS